MAKLSLVDVGKYLFNLNITVVVVVTRFRVSEWQNNMYAVVVIGARSTTILGDTHCCIYRERIE